MNKQELLADLATKVALVGTVEQISDAVKEAEGVTWYRVGIYEKRSATAVVRRNIHFYVLDEGQGTEKAFYQGEDPIPAEAQRRQIVDELQALAGASYLRLDYIDAAREWALGSVFVWNSGLGTFEKKLRHAHKTGPNPEDWDIQPVDAV